MQKLEYVQNFKKLRKNQFYNYMAIKIKAYHHFYLDQYTNDSFLSI